MKALTELAPAAVLASALAVLPAAVAAFRQLADQVAATIPHHASALDAAEFWTRVLGP